MIHGTRSSAPASADRLIGAGHWSEGDPAILIVFDAGYDIARLAFLLADLPVDVLGRLRGCVEPGQLPRLDVVRWMCLSRGTVGDSPM
jgi:DDE superfamily endonuclease